MTDAAPGAPTPAVSESSPSPAASTSTSTSTPATGDVEMETVNMCTIYGLAGWDGAPKIEKRLRDHSIPFKDVFKRKGPKEDTGTIYFDSTEQMNEAMTKMSGIREAPPAKSEEMIAAAAAAGTEIQEKLTKTVFKVRAPKTFTRPKRRAPPVIDRNEKREFRAAKRVKIELKEGDVGYEEMRSASEGEGEDDGATRDGPSNSPVTFEVERTINDVVAPLWRKPYPEQLVIKRDGVRELMQTTTRNWQREYGKTLTFPHQSHEPNPKFAKTTALFCKLEDIVPSPVIDAYRNKCEFSIGIDSKGEVAIGHLMGKYTAGEVTVESIQDCPHVPAIAKSLSKKLSDFITSYSPQQPSASVTEAAHPYKPYDKRDHSGFWRLFIVRNSFETKQAMCLIQVSGKGKTEEELNAFRSALKQYWREQVVDNAEWKSANDSYDLRAVQLQFYDGLSNAAPEGTPIELLLGEEACIKEKLMGLEFRVSQEAFFQINVPQTNRLYSIAADFASLPPVDAPQEEKSHHTLFDVCCGTGTIGLSLANRVGKVVGLEMCASAVEDAKYNAQANGITNAFYYVGKAEDTISVALTQHVGPQQNLSAAQMAAQADHIVTAIVDPPRSGLHPDVVRLLRKCPRIDRIVYVSCNPRSLMDNLQRFLQPASKRWTGQPFTAVKAVPVDMFPHSDHCEMVVLLERTKAPTTNTNGKASEKTNQANESTTEATTTAATSTEASTTSESTAPTSAPAGEAPADASASSQ